MDVRGTTFLSKATGQFFMWDLLPVGKENRMIQLCIWNCEIVGINSGKRFFVFY